METVPADNFKNGRFSQKIMKTIILKKLLEGGGGGIVESFILFRLFYKLFTPSQDEALETPA